MKRLASQYVYCSPHLVLEQTVLELNQFGKIERLFGLNDCGVETPHTVFINGVISTKIVSLKRSHVDTSKFVDIEYVDLSVINETKKVRNTAKLVIDFGTDNILDINRLIRSNLSFLQTIPLFDFIGACSYMPAKLLNIDFEVRVGNTVSLICWEDVDLRNKKLIGASKVNIIGK